MEPFTLYDPNTDECPVPQDLLRGLDQLSDDEMLDLLDRASSLQAELAKSIGDLKAAVILRMNSRGATALDTPLFTAKLEAGTSYAYDLQVLAQLKPLVTPEQYAKAIPTPEPKPNKAELNKLAKLGEEIKKIIDQAVRPVPTAPSFSYQRKPQQIEMTPAADNLF